MYSKTCPIPVKNVRDKLIEMTPLSSLLSDCLLIETLLFGDDSLSEEQNAQIFKSVQLYIKQTKRFTSQ